ncbi:MAG: hypothetical protein C5B54_01955 [Acidobacteria bacterium]|nr:MAG: hypothetical protein C5B54_01955 [Acidobacteriota bacterium]
MPQTQNTEKKLFGQILVDVGLVTAEQLEVALEEQKRHGGKIGFNLCRLGFVTTDKLTEFLEENFGVAVAYEPLSVRQKAADIIPRNLALYYKIAPIKLEGNTLTIGIAQIEHPNLIAALSEVTGHIIDPLLYPESEIRTLIDSSYKLPTERGVEVFSFADNVFTIVDNSKKIKPLAAAQLKNERDVGEWLRSIIAEAIKEKSREVLLKPDPDGASVSLKKDTFYLSEFSLPAGLYDDLTFLLLRLARMNPLELQKPQHSRFLVKIQERKIVMVVSAFPTIYGLRFLLEMFDERLLRRSFEEMTGPFPILKTSLEDFILRARQGMVIITGPEGSGRTSFLYSFFSRCKDEFKEILTLENAVRYPVSGLSQTQVDPDDMEEALENVIKQKPELVIVNAVRTVRSAELTFLITARMPLIAVMSSYDSFMAIDWLCRHGLKSAIKAGLLHTVISPRLIPLVCPQCSAPYEISPEEISLLSSLPDVLLKSNQGCDYCRHSDDQSSQMILECCRIDAEFISFLEGAPSASQLRKLAKNAGRKTLFDIALQQAVRGELDMQSVMKLQSF